MRYKRNPKLYEGKYLNLILKKDGSYSIYLRVVDLSTEKQRLQVAAAIYQELTEAFTYAG